MDETISLGATMLIRGDLAGQDIPERRKGVVECLAGPSLERSTK